MTKANKKLTDNGNKLGAQPAVAPVDYAKHPSGSILEGSKPGLSGMQPSLHGGMSL